MLEKIITQGNRKETIRQIIEYVGNSPERFSSLVDLFLGDDIRVTQTASWALGHIGEEQPELIGTHHEALINYLSQSYPTDAVKRNITRIYQFVSIPEEYHGKLYGVCLNLMLSSEEPVAVKAFSMRVCERIAELYPELIPELMDGIESIVPNGSAGIKSRGRRILARLHKKQMH